MVPTAALRRCVAVVLATSALLIASASPASAYGEIFANDDQPSIEPGGFGEVDVAANDTSDAPVPMSISSYSQGEHGNVSCSGTSCGYAPTSPTFFGTDSFTYTISNGVFEDTATVFVTVSLDNLLRPIADFNGGGTSDVAAYWPDRQVWFVQGVLTSSWGAPGDVPVPADYNGDNV